MKLRALPFILVGLCFCGPSHAKTFVVNASVSMLNWFKDREGSDQIFSGTLLIDSTNANRPRLQFGPDRDQSRVIEDFIHLQPRDLAQIPPDIQAVGHELAHLFGASYKTEIKLKFEGSFFPDLLRFLENRSGVDFLTPEVLIPGTEVIGWREMRWPPVARSFSRPTVALDFDALHRVFNPHFMAPQRSYFIDDRNKLATAYRLRRTERLPVAVNSKTLATLTRPTCFIDFQSVRGSRHFIPARIRRRAGQRVLVSLGPSIELGVESPRYWVEWATLVFPPDRNAFEAATENFYRDPKIWDEVTISLEKFRLEPTDRYGEIAEMAGFTPCQRVVTPSR